MSWTDLLKPGNAQDFFTREPRPQFDVDAREFSAANAWWLAELSRIVYRPAGMQPQRAHFLQRAGLQQRDWFSSPVTGTGAMLVTSDAPRPFAVLVFRGTEQKLQDFLHDADTLPVPAFGATVSVHRGFKRALNSVWTAIDAALDAVSCPVFFTGHSLGGALATLASARRAPQAAYVFGCPRVGDARFAEKLRGVALYRVVYRQDTISTVPPEALGFRHAGEEHRIGGSVHVARFPVALTDLGSPPLALADHAPLNYVEGV